MPKYMPLAEWKQAAESGSPPADVILHKTGLVEMSGGIPEKRTVDFTISTSAVDREKDVINQDGWDLKAYTKSPVVLFAHDYKQPPIGRTTNLRLVDGALKATVEFAPKDANPMAETVYQLVKGGFLSSASVGFRPHKHAFNVERGGVDFEKQELLEWSIVPVPANPEALMDAKGAGIDTAPLVAWAKGILDAEEQVTVLAPEQGKAATDDLRERIERIETALAQRAPAPDPVDEAVVFVLEEEPDTVRLFDPRDLRAAFGEALATLVTTEVRGAVNALRGRVD